jgi:hypothetical protein
MSRLDWTTVPLLVLPCVAGMIGMYYLVQPLVQLESHGLLVPTGLESLSSQSLPPE